MSKLRNWIAGHTVLAIVICGVPLAAVVLSTSRELPISPAYVAAAAVASALIGIKQVAVPRAANWLNAFILTMVLLLRVHFNPASVGDSQVVFVQSVALVLLFAQAAYVIAIRLSAHQSGSTPNTN